MDVQFTAAGTPLAVRHEGRIWAVAADPVRWFARDSCWDTPAHGGRRQRRKVAQKVSRGFGHHISPAYEAILPGIRRRMNDRGCLIALVFFPDEDLLSYALAGG
ncbi:hypothetical protein GCM10009825_18260 [Arthrobacter humicola]|uniref:Uncharacterized protein n=1 Tax=Arthrobacter humicola TaxID=409291 RepID=A0ABP5KM46_9MICC